MRMMLDREAEGVGAARTARRNALAAARWLMVLRLSAIAPLLSRW